MKKFEIYRADLDKIVCKEIKADDAAHAIGQYAAFLMQHGMIAMNDEACVMKKRDGNTATITTVQGKEFLVEAREI